MIVETGTIVTGANSYCTLAEANAYHTLYDNSDWAGTDADLELALIKACQSLDLLYGPKYASQVRSNSQSLLFPRYAFYDRFNKLRSATAIPIELKHAQCEIALKALNFENILPSPSVQSSIVSESITIDVIDISTSYKNSTNPSDIDGFRKIELILYPILANDCATPTFKL